jgi:hypothetical protein
MNEIPKFEERRKNRPIKFSGLDRRNRKKPKEPWRIPDSVLDGALVLAAGFLIFAVLRKALEL